MSILVIEDDTRVADFLQRGLKAEGYAVTVARDGEEGLEVARSYRFDAIILDLMLPRRPGAEVCRELRACGDLTPILMLTAMDGLGDKVEGLRIGADDFLTKPFAFEELLARLGALLRRGRGFTPTQAVLTVADLALDRDTLEVRRGARVIELTSKELALLELLMSASGKVFSRERILSSVWGASSDPLTNVVDVYVGKLRRKIDSDGEQPLIRTIRGRGYRIGAGDGASAA